MNVSISLEKKTVRDSWERLNRACNVNQRYITIYNEIKRKKNPKVEDKRDKGNNARTVEQ